MQLDSTLVFIGRINRSKLIDQLSLESVKAMRRLCQRDQNHAYIMERLWLHLFGEPFLHAKSEDAIRVTTAIKPKVARKLQDWNMRTAIIQDLAMIVGANSYLEIGLGDGNNFTAIQCARKESVDPSFGNKSCLQPTHHMTSDEFFKVNRHKFDIVFIDGCHHADHVERDLKNAIRVLNRGGVIVCHDLNPTTELMQVVPRCQSEWTGDGWKAWVRLRRERPDLCMFVINTDYGVGIILDGGPPSPWLKLNKDDDLKWTNFIKNRTEWLYLLPPISARDFSLAVIMSNTQ